jgi:hypothetical protein
MTLCDCLTDLRLVETFFVDFKFTRIPSVPCRAEAAYEPAWRKAGEKLSKYRKERLK